MYNLFLINLIMYNKSLEKMILPHLQGVSNFLNVKLLLIYYLNSKMCLG